MHRIAAGDDSLEALAGTVLASTVYDGVSYRLDRTLGTGSMAVAFRCERRSPKGAGLAVIKITRPSFVRQAAETARLTIRKESVALGRLNERMPPTPFVVRFMENGEIPVQFGGIELVLPWLAMEYVHGNTLEERVAEVVRETGAAFEPERAAYCVDAIASGLDAVHSVNVLHRDIKPNNVLCCGNFPDEIFKLSDFGVARPVGLRQTFMQGSMGTPGYASPEQVTMDEAKIGPASDVFSFAATVYSVLTGQELFVARNIMELVQQAQRRERRSILESPNLCEELRVRPAACRSIDSAIAHATAPDSRDRPQSAGVFGATIVAALRSESGRPAAPPPISQRRAAPAAQSLRAQSNWTWTIRHSPGDDRAIRSVGWDGSGSCLASTTRGLAFWNGTHWTDVVLDGQLGRGVRFVRHAGPGVWLIGGMDGLLSYYTSSDSPQRFRRPKQSADFEAASGQPEDLAVVVGRRQGTPPLLYATTNKRWLKPLPLRDVSAVIGLSRFDDDRWLLCGRRTDGTGFAGMYSPLAWEVEPIPCPRVRTYVACDAVPEVGMGIVVGSDGHTFRVKDSGIEEGRVPGGPDLSAVVMELNQRAWATSFGKIWVQTPQMADRWACAWERQSFQVPIVSLFADGRRVIGVAADGAVVEGCEF